MCFDIGGSSHFRERGVHEKGCSQNGNPVNPPGYGPGVGISKLDRK